MQLSDAARELLKAIEGTVKRDGVHVVYDDATGNPVIDLVGNPTIGHGHLMKDGEAFPKGITDDQADALLITDLRRFERGVAQRMRSLSGNQFDAFVIFAFNVGVFSLDKASAVNAYNMGRPEEVPARLALWSKARLNDGSLVESPGLKRRRHAEGMLFANGIDAAWKAWRS